MINLAKITVLTLLLALSFSMQTSAQTTAANNAQTAASIPRKADGAVDFDKWFVGKSSQEIKQLSKSLNDKDFEGYIAWKEDGIDKKRVDLAKVQAENDRLDAEYAKKEAYGAKLDAIIAALRTIEALGKKVQRGEQITDADKANLKIAVNTPGVNPMLIMGIKKHINID
jgi:transcription initiation factor TFIIIB Brf1 subunit/transcription initiation factor TFIIB